MKRIHFLLIAVLISLASCKTTNLLMGKQEDKALLDYPLDSAFHYNGQYQYQIRRDDKISISVWGQDELSVGSSYGIYNSNEVYGKWLMVDANGNIEVPKIGTRHVLHYTIAQLKEELKKEFATWVLNPIVDIKILNREITVLGEVRNPCVIPVDKEINTLLEVISRSGGFEFYANLKYVKVLRQEGENVRQANIDLSRSGDLLAQNIQLLPGDIIVVPSKKYKEFDKRVSVIIPFTTTVTAASILLGMF